MLESVQLIFSKMLEIYSTLIPTLIGLGVLFTVLALFESQQSSKGKVWWKNPGLVTDICYSFVNSVLAPYLRLPVLLVFTLTMSRSMSPEQINDYFANGRGPLSTLPFWAQGVVYLLLSDFMCYWIHRIFHGATMWRFHAIHHSATEVDWTTTYRIHPVNMMLQASFVAVTMMWLGIKPDVMAFFTVFDIVSASVVHANVNWTFGPLKYVFASPVFHRWHHGLPDDGGNSNFAPTFSFWDYLFGTFYMPEGRLPETFGVDDHDFPENYLKQLAYPFKVRHEPEGEIKTETP